MSTITTLGIGSGLDISALVDAIVGAERAPEDNRLTNIEETVNAKITAFGTIKSKLASVEDALSSLKSMSTFTSREVTTSYSGSAEVLTATATSTASLNTYEVEVTALAKKQSLYTVGFDSMTDTIGTGTMDIRFGTTVYDVDTDTYTSFTSNSTSTVSITVDSTNNTVTSMRDYINDNDLGFTASIVDDGSSSGNFILVLTSEDYGVENSMEIVITDSGDGDDTDSSGLSRLAFSSAATNLLEGQAAADAALTVNGISMTRSSNTIVSAIDGVTMTLTDVSNGSAVVNLTVARDTSGIEEDVNEFVDTYNEFIAEYEVLIGYDAASGVSGLLLGDATMNNISNLLRSNIGTVVNSLDSDFRALSDIGILRTVDGTLEFNSSTLTDALTDNIDDVGRLFAPIGTPDNSNVTFLSSTSSTVANTYAIEITTTATQGFYNGGAVLPATFGTVTIDSDNDDFIVRIDGYASDTLTLTSGDYTDGAALATEIQSRINSDSTLSGAGISVSVVYNDTDDRFDVTSASYGTGSTVAFTTVDTNMANDIGFSVASGTDGVNVEGTIDGTAATGAGRELVSTTGDSVGLKLLISATSTGSYGDVVFTLGKATELDNILAAILDTNGILYEQNIGFSSTLERVADDKVTQDYRIDKFEATLIAKFSVMDQLVASMAQTTSYLTQALDNLPGTYKKN